VDIIFGRENAEKLRAKYTVLDLETITAEDGTSMEVFCLIPAEKLNINDLPNLDQWIKLHQDFLEGYNTNQYDYCKDAISHLTGKFGGEVDSFYEEILRRIEQEETK
jgi:hypothetical protein